MVRCGPMHASTCSSYCNNGTLTSAKHVYGCVRRPFEYGSASSDSGANSYGGGAAHLIVASNLVVNGSMNTSGYQSSGFPGSAGSIYLECGVLSGSGTIYAYGIRSSGDPGCQSSSGRIAVKQTATNDVTSFTGTISTANSATTMNGGGTVYYEFADDVPGEGTLILDNAGQKAAGYYIQFNQYVTDATEPFGEIVIRNGAKLQVTNSLPLRVVKGLSLDSTAVLLLTSGDCLEFTGTDDATLTGAKYITLNRFVCTNAVKKIAFGTTLNDALTIPAGGELVLSGSGGECSLVLEPATAAATWSITVNADASADVKNVAVSNSNASAGAAILAVESEDLGGNSYWSFTSVIVPGETITWTGGASTDWGNGDNWDLGRTPVDTDAIVIAPATANPTLPSGTYVLNSLTVQTGATLTLSGCEVTVTNILSCAGALVFSGSETLHLKGTADFTGGSVTAANSLVLIDGEGHQTVDLGNCVFNKVTVRKSSGSVGFVNHGFTAGTFRCTATNALSFAFAAGQTFTFPQCYLNGGAMNRFLSLDSTESGQKWNLKLNESTQGVSGVTVTDCDASSGATAYAGATGVDGGNNVNWDFTTDVAAWIGGTSGDFTAPANWSGGTAPKAGTVVSIFAGDNEQITVTVPSTTNASFATLLLLAGDGGSANLVAKGALATSGDVTVDAGGVLTLDRYDDAGAAPNVIAGNLVVKSGGKVTHSGPAATETAKLHLAVTGDVTIKEGGAIDVSGKGYETSKGPGGSGGYQGPTYGGHGGGKATYYYYKDCYGSVFFPTNWGSGAANVNCNGGGAVHLVVAGTLKVDGTVNADGEGNGMYSGTGGSVWIECAELIGAGTMSAREGSAVWEYAGAGGRIAVYQRTAKSFAAFPRARFLMWRNGYSGPGTLYLEHADKAAKGADLIYDRGTLSPLFGSDFAMLSDGDPRQAYRNVNLIIGAHASVTVMRNAANEAQKVRIRSLLLEAATSKLVLKANHLIVTDPDYRRGRDWAVGATIDNTDTYLTLPGSIRYIQNGSVLRLR